MVAPTGVNEETPQEPVAAEPPGPVKAGLTQAEAAEEDPAGPAAALGEPPARAEEPAAALRKPPAALRKPPASLGKPPARAEELAADRMETVPAKAEPAGSAATDPVPADVVPAQAEPAQAELAQARDAEAGPAKAQAVSAGAATEEAAATELAEAGLAEAGLAEAGLAEAGLAEAGLAEAGLAEAGLTAAELAGTGLAEKGLTEKGAAEAGEPGPADKQENRAGDAQEAAEPREASRDVGPLAVVGIIVGVIALVGVAAGVLAMVTHGFKPKTVITYRPAAVFGLRPGQCVNAGPNSLSFTLVSCASPHDAEVFARFSLPAAAWPGSAAVRQEAGDGCASRLNGYLNPQLASIGLTQEYAYPNRAAWEASQRTVVCEVSSGNGRLTGSVRAGT